MVVSGRLAYSPEEVCDLLGLSRSTTYRLLRNNQIDHLRLARRILIPEKSLEKFLACADRPPEQNHDGTSDDR